MLCNWHGGDIHAWLAFKPVLFARLNGQPKRYHFGLISCSDVEFIILVNNCNKERDKKIEIRRIFFD